MAVWMGGGGEQGDPVTGGWIPYRGNKAGSVLCGEPVAPAGRG